MKTRQWIPTLFWLAAAYDGLLGLLFLTAGGWVFQATGTVPPNHPGYLQFPAALLLVFALMFATIAVNPHARRSLIPFGMLLKISYCGVVIHHWSSSGLPWIWKPFCMIDLAFLLLFIAAWVTLGITRPTPASEAHPTSSEPIPPAPPPSNPAPPLADPPSPSTS